MVRRSVVPERGQPPTKTGRSRAPAYGDSCIGDSLGATPGPYGAAGGGRSGAMENYGDFQLELYLAGLAGGRPALPIDPERLAERARAALAPEVWSYVA